jgi:hypothetical protein
MLAEGVSHAELLAIVEDPEHVETGENLVAYYGSPGGRVFRVLTIADTEPTVVLYFMVKERR